MLALLLLVVAGIRVNALRIEQLGWHVRRFQIAIFVVSGCYAGIAGALLAYCCSTSARRR